MKKSNRRWFLLIIGTIAMLFAGIIYAWSILKSPLLTDLRFGSSALAWNFTITMGMFCIGGISGSVLSKKLGVKLPVILGGLICGAGFVLTSFLQGSQLPLLYVTYGVMSGIGIGIAYNVLVSTLNQWFPDKRGLCSGCLMMGFGASTLLLGTISNSLFGTIGWRMTYVLLGIAIGAVLIIAGLFLSKPQMENVPAQEKKTEQGAGDFSPAQMLKSALFWKIFLFLVFLTAVANSIASFAKDFSLFAGASEGLATLLVGIFAVCNGVFRVIIGVLFDKLGRRKALLLCSGLVIMTSGVCIVAAVTQSLFLCILGLCLAGFTLGCCPTIGAVAANTFFGETYYPVNFSIINCNLLVASFMATLSNTLVANTGGYVLPFAVFLGISLIGLVLNISMGRTKKEKQDN